MSEDERLIYQQDCESFRYEDRLFWSRFQTMSAIEAASVGVILTETVKGWPAFAVALVTFLLVCVVTLLALNGREDSQQFIARISEYESRHTHLAIRPYPFLGIDSKSFTIVVFIVLGCLNGYLILFTLAFSNYHILQ